MKRSSYLMQNGVTYIWIYQNTTTRLPSAINAVFARLPVRSSAPRAMNPVSPAAGWLFYAPLSKGGWIGTKNSKGRFMIVWVAAPAPPTAFRLFPPPTSSTKRALNTLKRSTANPFTKCCLTISCPTPGGCIWRRGPSHSEKTRGFQVWPVPWDC